MNTQKELSTSEILQQQYVMRRRSERGSYHYDQLNVYFNELTNEYRSRWFSGRSRNSMSFRGDATYAIESLVEDRVAKFISQGEDNGYELIDRVVCNFADVPFSKFAGAKLAPITLDKLNKTSEWTDSAHTVFIPYCHGEHVCIRIGMQDAFSVQCMNEQGVIIQLKPKDEAKLRQMVRLQEYETFVIEAILTPHGITFLDLLCVNGVPLKWPFRKRMALLSKLIKEPKILTGLISPANIDVYTPDMTLRIDPVKRPISGYAVKSLKAPVNLDDVVITPVIEQHFIIRIYPSHNRDVQERELRNNGLMKLLLLIPGHHKNQPWIEVGTMIAKLGHEQFHLVKCDGIKNGRLNNPKPFNDNAMADYLREEDASVLEQLERNWALTLNYELSTVTR